MASSGPFWEIHKSDRSVVGLSRGKPVYGTQPFWAVLKAKNGRKVATTETYRTKQAAFKAIATVDGGLGREIRDLTKNSSERV